jgi:hypothetical protein
VPGVLLYLLRMGNAENPGVWGTRDVSGDSFQHIFRPQTLSVSYGGLAKCRYSRN